MTSEVKSGKNEKSEGLKEAIGMGRMLAWNGEESALIRKSFAHGFGNG